MPKYTQQKMIQKLFSISHEHLTMIENLMSVGLFSSHADVVRHAILALHEKYADKIKEKSNAKNS